MIITDTFNAWISIITLVSSILFFVFAKYSELKNKRKSISIHESITYTIFKKLNELEGIEIKYKRKVIDNVFCLECYLLNTSKRTLVDNDFLAPISFLVSDCISIINYSVSSDNKYNVVESTIDKNVVNYKVKTFVNNTFLKIVIYYINETECLVTCDIGLKDGIIISKSFDKKSYFYFDKKKAIKTHYDNYYLKLILVSFCFSMGILLSYIVLNRFDFFSALFNRFSMFNKFSILILATIVMFNILRLYYFKTKYLAISKWYKF